ncbi:dipeptidase [Clostridium sp. AM58-1XD]|uniref:dipeptidase n=1 Tax=Clostridium sp. AM58-1XD TaxID=2292307 RepID=UPI0015F7618E|nr:dipeptidase [Clostridium sp. AM58-1XD]
MEVTEDRLYDESIIIDTCAPLATVGDKYRHFINGRLTAIGATIFPVTGYLPETIKGIAEWYDRINKDERLLQVLKVDDIYKAKKEKKLGIIFSFQGTNHIQSDISLLEIYYRLGLRQILLCYNKKNAVGDGCEEPSNGGLSIFGEKVIKEMNRLGIVVDLAHTGYRTTMEAMEVSDKPCIFSHGNPYNVHHSPRNLKDEQVIKIAKMGGVIGINGFPTFVSDSRQPDINQLIDHIDYYTKLIGIDHICIGLDYCESMAGVIPDDVAMKEYTYRIETGQWSPKTYPPPPYHFPKEIEIPDMMPNIVPALKARGYADSDIKKILGENYIRVLNEVW